MKVSVVMAVYNGAEFLEEQLRSILDQTVQPDEVILTDDGSSDGTVGLARNFIDSHGLSGRWKVFENPKNLGYAENFHRAVGLASGEALFFADQDDLWLPDKIEKMLAVMEAHPDCVLLSTDYEPFSEGKESLKVPEKVLRRMPGDGSLEKSGLTPKHIYIGAIGCCMAVKRSFYEHAARYRFSGWAQDDFLWKLAQVADGSFLWHTNLVRHRIHGRNTSTYGNYHAREKRISHFKTMRRAAVRMLAMLKDCHPDEKKEILLRRHIRMLELRIRLMEKRALWNAVLLLPYLGYYEKTGSWLLELFIAVR